MMCFSCCWIDEEEVEQCSAFMLWCEKSASDKYKKINEVAKGNVNEYIVNELKYCEKERKHLYD